MSDEGHPVWWAGLGAPATSIISWLRRRADPLKHPEHAESVYALARVVESLWSEVGTRRRAVAFTSLDSPGLGGQAEDLATLHHEYRAFRSAFSSACVSFTLDPEVLAPALKWSRG